MGPQTLCGAIAFAGFAAVSVRALRRVLPPDAWHALLFLAVVLALVLSAAFADTIDHAVLWQPAVAGSP